ncbi:MAG TPA: CGNR zinc finger domain-containing protein [Propionibacteriaceae bacterium]|nr:CGNR zinc finger domain-containing protein [Propionibacteriaceae bacterium]
METPAVDAPVRPLNVVGGNLALDFANTVDDPGGPAHFDHIRDLPLLLTWARNIEVLSDQQHAELAALARDRPTVAAASLRRAHLLRRTVQLVFGAIADGQPITDQPWHDLRRSIAESIGHAGLTAHHDEVRLVWDGASLDALTWPVAYAAHELLTSDRLSRVKRCAACPWLYVDQSKNSSRRWCNMEDCGKYVKMRRYVERRAAKRRAVLR